MKVSRAFATATLLLDGRVLIAGGLGVASGNFSAVASAELYDPSLGAFVETGRMTQARLSHTATLLPDGRVLVAGGNQRISTTGGQSDGELASAEVYDPANGRWTPVGQMAIPRARHAAVLLDDGSVLVTGGIIGSQNYEFPVTGDSERFDPTTQTWESRAPMFGPRLDHSLVSLPDGRVMVIAGNKVEDASHYGPTRAVDIYDPATNTWGPGPSMLKAHFIAEPVVAADGTIVVAGGVELNDGMSFAEAYTPGASEWVVLPEMSVKRRNYPVVALPTGDVLAIGGATTSDQTIERLNPARTAWSPATPLLVPRDGATATLLADCSVLVAGSGSQTAELLPP